MTDWIVRSWARFGHERLYAETPGGTALGYLDLKTGRYHSDDLTNLPLLQRAIGDHFDSRNTARQARQSGNPPSNAANASNATTPESRKSDPPRDWEDISATPAGAAAREQAIAEREAQGGLRHVLARAVGARTDERAWRIGAQGEQAVAKQLAKLGPEWLALHSVRVGEHGSDIDHIIVGPPGVFTVNTKHHPNASIWVGGDTFMINGQRVPYVRNSRHEARRAARLLTERAGFPVAVWGVIAVVGARKGFKVKKQPEDGAVVIVARTRVSQHLRSLPVCLTDREIDSIYQVARRSTTWH